MENKHEGNENKIILGEFNCITDISLFIKNTKHNHSSASDWWENAKSSFKEDARTFSENSRKY